MCAFWKPGTVQPGSQRMAPSAGQRIVGLPASALVPEAGEPDAVAMMAASQAALAGLPLQQQRLRLPIRAARRELLFLVETNPTVVVVGETGSGKTTQLPQYLHEAGWTSGGRVVVCTQPRRVAAISVAARVAQELGTVVGQEVGYAVRFDEMWDRAVTRIKYMTDGLLLRELLLDPLLASVSVVMVDEAHERTVQTDMLLAVLKKVQRRRKDFRVIVASATVNAEVFRAYFHSPSHPCAVVTVEGRQHPVDVLYLEDACSDFLKCCLTTVCDIHTSEPAGDILVFLTGQEEIDVLYRLLVEREADLAREAMRVRVLPLHSALPPDAQMAVFKPCPFGVRKIVLATNIAETSVTIDNIVHVVDCCFVKERSFDPNAGMEALHVVPVSKASAAQRAGRAGRVQAGKCYRLCPEDVFERATAPHSVPEVQRSNMLPIVLHLKALGVDDVAHFDFISPPPVESLVYALDLMHALGVVDDGGRLTDPLGLRVAEFPLDPLLAVACLGAERFQCSEEVASVAALLSLPPAFLTIRELLAKVDKARRTFAVAEGDHVTLLNVFNVFSATPKAQREAMCSKYCLNHQVMAKAVAVRAQIVRFMRRFKVALVSCGDDVARVNRCFASAYFCHAAQRAADGVTYHTVRGKRAFKLHPGSVLTSKPPQWIVYHEVVSTSEVFARYACEVQGSWLLELAPKFFHVKQKPL